ncbi:MAG: GIY-YIG nuclease family protein [Clostridium sp.]|uniref:GIY-YIG nuclease family protein n=1 Tax=Clostridium sp. TaxID=1506 RepID=UPI003EE57B43
MKGVYVLKSNKKELLKIGKAEDFDKRLKDFERQSNHLGNYDEKFEYVLKIECCKNEELEKILHKRFLDKNIVGEWFDIKLEEIKSFCENLNMENYLKDEKTEINNNKVFGRPKNLSDKLEKLKEDKEFMSILQDFRIIEQNISRLELKVLEYIKNK